MTRNARVKTGLARLTLYSAGLAYSVLGRFGFTDLSFTQLVELTVFLLQSNGLVESTQPLGLTVSLLYSDEFFGCSLSLLAYRVFLLSLVAYCVFLLSLVAYCVFLLSLVAYCTSFFSSWSLLNLGALE